LDCFYLSQLKIHHLKIFDVELLIQCYFYPEYYSVYLALTDQLIHSKKRINQIIKLNIKLIRKNIFFILLLLNKSPFKMSTKLWRRIKLFRISKFDFSLFNFNYEISLFDKLN
jgi:hypothetical protein